MWHVIGIGTVVAITFGTGCSHPANDQRSSPQAQPIVEHGAPSVVSEAELREESITFELDIPYAATENPRQRLDLYRPETPKLDKLPVIVFFHGGHGLLAGDKSDGTAQLLPLLRTRDYAAVSVAYRLPGEATWPAPLHDSKAAIRWLRANAKHYGIDPDRIAVWGVNAGAHLALMLGVTGDVPELEGEVGPHTGITSEVSAVVNFFGVVDMLALVDQPSRFDRTRADAPEALVLGGALPDNPEMAVAASPITYVSANDPPVLTLHGTHDDFVAYAQALSLHEALTAVGVPSYLIAVHGAGHGEVPEQAEERVGAFFANVLLGRDVEISTAPLHSPAPE